MRRDAMLVALLSKPFRIGENCSRSRETFLHESLSGLLTKMIKEQRRLTELKASFRKVISCLALKF